MDSRTGRDIEVSINNKLKKALVSRTARNRMLGLINHSVIREHDAIKHASLMNELVNTSSLTMHRDIYNNESVNFLDYTVSKTKSSFNLLRLFKPGEILSSVISA